MNFIIFRLCLITLFTVSNLFAQKGSYRFYYPLNIGDVWEYEYRDLGTLVGIESREVIGDTLMPNGKTYRIIETDFPLSATRYQQLVDSTFVYQLHQRFESGQIIYDEFLLFDLDIQEGYTWNFSLSPSDSGFFKVIEIADTTLCRTRSNLPELKILLYPILQGPLLLIAIS